MHENNKKNNQYIMRDAAERLAALYFSIIPVNFDKKPNVKSWKPYQEHIANAFEISDMFAKNETGIAIITGKVSLNTELLDEDLKYDLTGTMHDEFVALLNEVAPGLYEKLLIQRTRSKGHHYIYRCEKIEGNTKLASRPTSEEERKLHPNEKVKVLYETRGEGGYAVCEPTPGYEIIQGSFENIPTITKEEREILFSVARSFNQCIETFIPPKPKFEFKYAGLSPFEDYNQKCDVVSLLVSHGWSVVNTKGSKTFLKRPGQTDSVQSGNYDRDKNWLTIFSTSTEFKTETAYLPYAVFAMLECNGDFSEASKRLRELGYGDKIEFQNQNDAKTKSTNNSQNSKSQNQDVSHLPVVSFSNEVFDNLPEFLKQACFKFSTQIERDVFLVGALGILSGCFPQYYSYYDKKRTACNLFLFVYGPPSVGKGSLEWAKLLGNAIHRFLLENYEIENQAYKQELETYEAQKKDRKNKGTTDNPKPIAPKRNLLFIPANSSTSAIIEAINNNKGRGIIYSTEADSLTEALKQEWGNFSDILRAGFHSEYMAMLRRKDNEYAEMHSPEPSLLLSGTPRQMFVLIPDPENGLNSRFAFFEVDVVPVMKNVFESDDSSFEDYFKSLGDEVLTVYKSLIASEKGVCFKLTQQQKERFIALFSEDHDQFYKTLGDSSIASIRRLAVICYRIAMILSMLRTFETGELSPTITCNDIDFENALRITEVFKSNAQKLLLTYPKEFSNPFGLKGNCLKFYQAFPFDTPFTLEDAMKVADSLNINHDTAQGWLYTKLIPKGAFIHSHNNYIKPA